MKIISNGRSDDEILKDKMTEAELDAIELLAQGYSPIMVKKQLQETGVHCWLVNSDHAKRRAEAKDEPV